MNSGRNAAGAGERAEPSRAQRATQSSRDRMDAPAGEPALKPAPSNWRGCGSRRAVHGPNL